MLTGGLVFAQPFTCNTPTRAIKQMAPEVVARTPDGTLCSRVFVQVDYAIVEHFGLTAARAHVEGLMAEVAVPYADIDVELSYEYDYLTSPQYTAGGSYEMLLQFQQANPGINEDVAILLYLDSSGGIAWVDVSCRDNSPYKYAFANITTNYLPYREGFSWSVEVVAHELGHNYGSQHTHDQAWNGNGTAIDGCGGGGGPIPGDGGTIMSYCHLNPVGINFEKGFHPQVAAVIRANIYARCTDCANPGGPDDPDPPVVNECTDYPVFLDLIADAYPEETRYQVTNAQGAIIHTAGPFTRDLAGESISDTLCLTQGCYTYTIFDENGLAPNPNFPCGGGLFYVGDPFGEFGSGQDFTGSESVQICLGVDPPTGECLPAGPYPDHLEPYVNQDRQGGVSVSGENFVKITGNSWQYYGMNYSFTVNTVLEGDVFRDGNGEIHGIAFVDQVGALAPANTIQFGGTQDWGIEFPEIPVGVWTPVSIPVGLWVGPGDYTHVVLINDHDVPFATAVTGWRNLEFCESGAADLKKAWPQVRGTVEDEVVEDIILIKPYPNPARDSVTLPYSDLYHLFTAEGKHIETGYSNTIDLQLLPPGLYLIAQGGKTFKIVKQ